MKDAARRKGDRRSVGTRKKVDPRRVWPTEGWATIGEVGEYFRIGRSTVYKLMDQGKIPFEQFGDMRRIPWMALRRIEREAAARRPPV